MTDWLPIRIKTEPAKMKHVQNRIAGYPEEVMTKRYFQLLQRTTAAAADVMREYIATHDFGDKNGPGRVDSGKMRDSVKWEGRKDAKGVYRFRFGWINGTPGYSIFQEYGTKNGVVGMDALGYAAEFFRKELRLEGVSSRGFRANRAPRFPRSTGSN